MESEKPEAKKPRLESPAPANSGDVDDQIHGHTLPKIRIGTSLFKDLVLHSDVIVDKSLLIKEAIEDSAKSFLITRPRRWGKSLNMDMLKTFLEIEVDKSGQRLSKEESSNFRFFHGGSVKISDNESKKLGKLKISDDTQCMSKLGKYPVILVSFNAIRCTDYQSFEEGLKTRISKAFSQHRYLKHSLELESSELKRIQKYLEADITAQEIQESIYFLSDCLKRHFGQSVWVLIDEYDYALNHAYVEFGIAKNTTSEFSFEFKKALDLFKCMIDSGIKSNDENLEKAMVTGILKVALFGLFSGANSTPEYDLLSKKFSSHYGFSELETDDLLKEFAIDREHSEQMKAWYNGYNYGNVQVYNPWSVMRCLAENGEIANYWLHSGGTDILENTLLTDKIQQSIRHLILSQDNTIEETITKDINLANLTDSSAAFSLLLFSGYLNPVNYDTTTHIARFAIPNKEVTETYTGLIQRWTVKRLDINSSQLNCLTRPLYEHNIESFKSELENFLQTHASFKIAKSLAESNYHFLMIGILFPLANTHYIFHELESGKGYADTIIIPMDRKKTKATIFEYKLAKSDDPDVLSKSSRDGLEQITANKYDSKIKIYEYIKSVIKVGVAFIGKSVDVTYQEDILVANNNTEDVAEIGVAGQNFNADAEIM